MAEEAPSRHPPRLVPILGAALVVATVSAYLPVLGNAFVNYDDPLYVTENPHVKAGLTREGVRWALTATDASNWHPLTWMSLQLDRNLFGPYAWGCHLMNLLLHAANAVLLFLLLWRMTGAVYRSFLVAALFALHPLHVESVAWAAERKDVLSTLFGLLAVAAYLRYVERPALPRLLLVAGALALSLAAKPMLVTLPALLLLLDYWPLGRLWPRDRVRPAGTVLPAPASLGLVLGEKLPLLGLAAASGVITVLVQYHAGAVRDLRELPLDARVANAVVSYAAYLGKALGPVGLAPFYPFRPPAAWQVAAAGAVLVGVSALAALAWRRRPYLVVGWLWYLVSLVPVIGLVQVGVQALADRYTYVPLIGPFVGVVWGLADLASGRARLRAALGVAAAGVLLACAAGTWLQAGRWHDSVTLWEHTLRVTTDNPVAEQNLGAALLERGDLKEAEPHLRAAVALQPDFVRAYDNLGIVLDRLGRLDEAVRCYRKSLELNPDQVTPHVNLGIDLGKLGKGDEAVTELSEAVRLDPNYAEGHYQLALALMLRQLPADAVAEAWQCVRLDRQNAHYRALLARLLRQTGDVEEARAQEREAERLGGGWR